MSSAQGTTKEAMQCYSIQNRGFNAGLEEYRNITDIEKFSVARVFLCPLLVAPGCFPLLDNIW